jgi:hypothetical protein
MEPRLQEASLRLLLRQLERSLVRRARVGRGSDAPAQVRPRRVRRLILRQVAAAQDPFDERERRLGSVAHRDRHGPIELDHG